MASLNDDCLSRLIELAKFETLMKLLKIVGLDWDESDNSLSLRDILKILVRNGCPVDALLSTLKEIGEKLTKEGDGNE